MCDIALTALKCCLCHVSLQRFKSLHSVNYYKALLYGMFHGSKSAVVVVVQVVCTYTVGYKSCLEIIKLAV